MSRIKDVISSDDSSFNTMYALNKVLKARVINVFGGSDTQDIQGIWQDQWQTRRVQNRLCYVGKSEFHEKYITIRFGMRIKNTNVRDNVTLVLYTRMDGALTGRYMLSHILMKNLENLGFKSGSREIGVDSR